MNFNSLEFLVLFLPATLLAFYAVPMRLRLWVMAGASLFFYGVSGLEVLAAFLITIAWSYSTAFLLAQRSKASTIALAISLPLFVLIMFKYLNFILDTVQAQPATRDHFWFFLSIVLPAGISFYTFELVCYSIDVADRKIEPERDPLRFLSFATFFPHLIAGPIMRFADLRDQLRALQEKPILEPKFASGLKLLSIGLFFKVFVADLCGMFVAKATDLPQDQLMAFDEVGKIADRKSVV